MPFRAAFDCLWCGSAHRTRARDDLEGWASLCPECVGKAGDNDFLRYRLRAALDERARAAAAPVAAVRVTDSAVADADQDAELKAYYGATLPGYDDWYRRRGRYSRGPVLDLPWHQELDHVTQWLDGVPLSGEIVELAAGTGWWSPLLAQKGELSLYDAVPETLDRARERLQAHHLRAHLHVRDAWAEPDRKVDGVFCGFWLSHVTEARLEGFLSLVRRWLQPGGRFCFIDSKPGGDTDGLDRRPIGDDGLSLRRLDDGREFRVPVVLRTPLELTVRLRTAGFSDASVSETERSFVMGLACS